MKLVAKTLHGLEHVLAKEIKEQGAEHVEIANRAVTFEGDLEVLYRVNLWSRTALRVLTPIANFSAHNETVLYKRVRRIDWTKLFGLDQTFAINSTVHSSLFGHSQYVALKVKDAIVDLFRLKYNSRRPSIDIKNPDFLINVHCRENEFTFSIDCTGESLHKRGYRESNRPAPLNEVLAAGMILLSGWKADKPFFDPMCGSGTLLLEALLIAQNIPPRMNRDYYSFMSWDDYDSSLWNKIRLEAMEQKRTVDISIIGHDVDKRQIKEAKSLVNRLGYQKLIHLDTNEFTGSLPPSSPGIIITNPPYGERISVTDIEELYQNIGDTLKKNYDGWEAWIISSNKAALKKIGLRPSQKQTLFNGALECKYQKFEMYQGSKKPKGPKSESNP